MIHTDTITFQYKNNNHVFSFPNITLDRQENLLVLGKSGVGKTTFLHLLAGLLRAKKGCVIIDNVDINTLSNSKLDQFRGKNIGLVFQKKHAIPTLNVFENLEARLFLEKNQVILKR